ncbi:putative zinc-binding protein [Colwellia ponticola]|uniref:Zinc-binding protein n=1 Tax=Colwellia ponticola TaxID=2304625 RepID=A0A8H2JMI5_9GAMM|nr:putative zinc-binding protein [Colwellia ponticola]TMM46854.1 zinc-binding protein [Colwellia ponticola]
MSSLTKTPIFNNKHQSNTDSEQIQGKPIVYSCSGCSNLAQMAHNISLTLDSDGIAQMSCVAGVIANIEPIIALARSGRPIIALDGCQLACAKTCLDKSDIKIDHYFNIGDLGFDKRDKHHDSLTENSIAMKSIYSRLMQAGISFVQ